VKIITSGALGLGLLALLGLFTLTSAAQNRIVGGGLDCNGHSPISINPKANMICADRRANNGGRFWDNGYYVGHDEPSIQSFSSTANSGDSMAWVVVLPAKDTTPSQSGGSVANFELYPAFWVSLALCDPNSFPFNPCTPDSDSNSSNILTGGGSAVLELQFYPPGWPPFINQISCSATQWCAALNIDSAELNTLCLEPVNFAFLQTNGTPTGPPAPGQQTIASMTPNSNTLMMNPGDVLIVVVTDTSTGLLTYIKDVTTGGVGYMFASASLGFANTNTTTCQTTPFTFHPEYSTANASNTVPWAALQLNVNFAVETGHFELGASGDSDSDDAPCFSGPTIAGCLAQVHSGDTDFDGPPYRADWPDGSTNHPQPLAIVAGSPFSLTSGGFTGQYPNMQFETNVPYTESVCNPFTGTGCTVPPSGAAFYPFYSQGANASTCFFTFGNDVAGVTANDFGKDAEYGRSNTAEPALFTSGSMKNPCTP
jgi:hypothetical protein